MLANLKLEARELAEQSLARAELAWADGKLNEAETAFRRAIGLWLETSSRVHAAHVRLRLHELLSQLGDAISADLELSSAEAVFRETGAGPVVLHCQQLAARGALPN